MHICTALTLIRSWQLRQVASCEKCLLSAGSKDRIFRRSPELAVRDTVVRPFIPSSVLWLSG